MHNIRNDKKVVEFGLVSQIFKLSNNCSINLKGEKEYCFNYKKLKSVIPKAFVPHKKQNLKAAVNAMPRPVLEAIIYKLREVK